MKKVAIFERAGVFAENKDIAREIRNQEIIPALEMNEEVVVDFQRVTGATQSFIHALISEVMRRYGVGILERMSFKSCTDTVKQMINIVVDYMQEGMGIETDDE